MLVGGADGRVGREGASFTSLGRVSGGTRVETLFLHVWWSAFLPRHVGRVLSYRVALPGSRLAFKHGNTGAG